MDLVDSERQFDEVLWKKNVDKVIQVEFDNEKRYDNNVLLLIANRQVVDEENWPMMDDNDDFRQVYNECMKIKIVDWWMMISLQRITTRAKKVKEKKGKKRRLCQCFLRQRMISSFFSSSFCC